MPSIPLGGRPAGIAGEPWAPSQPPSAWQAAPPQALTANTMVPVARRVWAGVAVLGTALVVMSTFTPWFRADIEGSGLREGSGWHNVFGETGWGPLLVLLAAVTAFTVAPLLVAVRPGRAGILGIAASVLCLAVCAYQLIDIGHDRPGVDVTLSSGIYVLCCGAIVAFVGTALAVGRRHPAKVSPPRAVGAVG